MSLRPRILFLNGRLSDRGGADRWLLGVLARLQDRATTLLGVGYLDPALPDREAHRVGPWIRLKGLDRRGLRRRGLDGALARLRQAMDDFAPDLIHVNDVTDPDLLALVAGTGRGMMTVQDHRFFCPGQGKMDRQRRPCDEPMGDRCLSCLEDPGYAEALLALTRRRLAALGGMRRITVLSRYMAGELTSLGLEPARVAVLPPFVDGLGGEPAREPTHHLLAGRLALHKGVETALDAAGGLEGLPLLVAGDGPLRGLVERHAAEGARVQDAGWVDRQELGRLLAGACSLWLPSLWAEPFGIVGLEALSAAVPVIAADVGGVSDWLTHERHGLLVQPGAAGELQRAADRLANHPDLARRLGSRGRRRVARDFDAEALMLRLMRLYEEVAPGGL